MEHTMEACALDPALDVIVGKWKCSILFHLFHGTKRFSELQKGIPDITKKMLTSQLRELEEHDIIQRVVYPVVPPKVEYSLTEYGRTLEPVLSSIHQWGRSHAEHMRVRRSSLILEDTRQSL
ncbi:transcriptional regulator [Brevibacillus nitrificans]|uniref:Transcriptional regulator n=1 Tax=Brevibacillus nitrificans TaxID=651560 RepID=A0A3M8DLQ0_9BACL|nr:helix-turn-helix domain-containing protein [Brevibacillus nitrificans]RNB88559.1 transcriptional regulator [Brevibacillus nitrificans]